MDVKLTEIIKKLRKSNLNSIIDIKTILMVKVERRNSSAAEGVKEN